MYHKISITASKSCYDFTTNRNQKIDQKTQVPIITEREIKEQITSRRPSLGRSGIITNVHRSYLKKKGTSLPVQ